jgi:hypothetical protein
MSPVVETPPSTASTDTEAARAHAARVEEKRQARRAVWARREAQVRALYPHCRTFEITTADAVGADDLAASTRERLPRTLTLVTPDPDDPAKDHLFVGPYPVLSRNLHYDRAFEELTFATSDGENPIKGHLRLFRSRTRAHGTLSYGGQAFAVELAVKPQRYRMIVGKGAGYLGGSSTAPKLTWNVDSDQWKNAPWTAQPAADFTYGVTGSQIIGDQVVYDFVATFDDLETKKEWVPFDGDYVGYVSTSNVLKFAVQAGVKPPKSRTDDTLFPYILQCQLSPFAYDFVGAMLCDRPDLTGNVYGLKGTWVQPQAAGVYLLDSAERAGGGTEPVLVGVHDGRLYLGDVAVDSSWHGHRLHWSGLDADGPLGVEGYLEFAPDGHTLLGSSLGCGGWRIHPDAASDVISMAGAASGDVAMFTAAKHAEKTYDINDLIAMSQFSLSESGNYYDKIQAQSMEDFYAILQNFMDADIRKQFFDKHPPPLDPGLYGIAHTPGKRGGDPKQWYGSLSVAYASTALSKFSSDPGAKLLNERRASTWLTNQTGIADVMQAQAPLLYARRYQAKYDSLDWFLNDQRNNAEKYRPAIEAKAAEWIAEVETTFSGTKEELQKVIDNIAAMRDKAIADKLFWAFTLFAYTSRPAYLNMLQTILMSGEEIDGSEFTQRVQRTVAMLTILDTSSFFAGEYAYLLQLFQVSTVLPQLADFSGDLADFNLVVKLILDKFIETYINSPDPKMKDAAEKLREHASQELVGRVLQVLRQAAAANSAIYNWTNLVATFESRVAQVFGALPGIVSKMIMMGAAGLLISYFVTGQASWNDLTPAQRTSIIIASAGVLAQVTLMITTRAVAFSQVFNPAHGLWKNFKLFFSSKLLERAQALGAQGFRGFLLGSRGLDQQAAWLSRRANMALLFGNAAEAAALQAKANRVTTLQKIFGRNMNEFVATRLGAFMAAAGIVVSALLLAQGGEPMEVAANALFLAASVLEFIAAAGLWATQAFGVVAIGGLAVSSIMTVLSVFAIAAFVAGAILIAVLLFRPQDSPVTKFAKEKAGVYYMPDQTEIDYLEVFQKGTEPQRAGLTIHPEGSPDACLYVGGDGTLSQRKYDGTGNSALYLNVDELGRAQFGAPLINDQKQQTMLVLAVDEAGKLVAAKPTEKTTTTTSMMWVGELQGPGTKDGEFLVSARFKLYNVEWFAKHQTKRYLTTDGTGWKVADSSATVLVLTMVSTKPQGLKMTDIVWNTLQHDQHQAPVLTIPGSAPWKWTITPALTEGLILYPETGTVGMQIGATMRPLPKAEYTLKVDNGVGQLSTTFSITIEEQHAIGADGTTGRGSQAESAAAATEPAPGWDALSGAQA